MIGSLLHVAHSLSRSAAADKFFVRTSFSNGRSSHFLVWEVLKIWEAVEVNLRFLPGLPILSRLPKLYLLSPNFLIIP